MKTKLFILIISLLFIGCKSSKPLVSTLVSTKTEEHVKNDIVVSTIDKQSEQSSQLEEKTVVEDEKTITISTDYDTDKPVDPVTGKPPVKSETTTETIKNRKEETKSDEKTTKNAESESSIVDKSNIDTNQDKKESITEESPKDPYRYRYIFYIVASVIFSGLIIFLYYKRSKILFFFKKKFGY